MTVLRGDEDEIDALMASWNSHDRWAIGKRLAEIARSSAAELERERTQNLDLRTAAENACVRWESDDPSDPNGWYLGQMRLMRLLRAALSTQEESK